MVDYSSYRWLKIRNVSKASTSYIYHKECGENKVHFSSINARAYNENFKGERLHVETCSDIQPNFVQKFKIHFLRPLEPGEETGIFYRIDWPGEPSAYCLDNISQSINISRYKCGVERLTFCVMEKTKMIDVYINKITSNYSEVRCPSAPQYLLAEEDIDLTPLHNKAFHGVYYHFDKPKDVAYRIYYKLISEIESPAEDVF